MDRTTELAAWKLERGGHDDPRISDLEVIEGEVWAFGQHLRLEGFALGIRIGDQLVTRVFAVLIAVSMPAVVDDRKRVAVIVFGILVKLGLTVVAVQPPAIAVVGLGRDEWLTGEFISPRRAAAELNFFERQIQLVAALTARRGAVGCERDDVFTFGSFTDVIGLHIFCGHGDSSMAFGYGVGYFMDLDKRTHMEKFELKVEAVRLKESGLLAGNQISAGTEAAPIYLNVDTGFDYAAITTAVIGLIVAVVVAKFTVSVQRNQIQANISNFRHQWMVELRESASELIQLAALMINASTKDNNYKPSALYTQHYSRVMQLRAKIDLLLSRDDDESFLIRKTCGDLLRDINALQVGDSVPDMVDKLVGYQDLLRKELEGAWEDTKDDLGINERAYGKRLFSRR